MLQKLRSRGRPIQLLISKMPLWILWLAATTVAGIVGWAFIAVTGMGTLGFSLIAAGTVIGVCIGIAQAQCLVLARGFSRRQQLRWICLTILGGTICWIVVVALRTLAVLANRELLLDPITPWLCFGAGGSVYGMTQMWLLSDKRQQLLIVWIPTCTLSWAIGGVIGLRAADVARQFILPNYYPGGDRLIGFPILFHAFVSGTVASFVFALLTGMVLQLMLRNR